MMHRPSSTRPNLFILGGAKCGTTALAQYLDQHPNVFFSYPKEPHFFSTDLAPRFRLIRSEDDYLNICFHGADTNHRVLADGSISYLFSDVATDNILEFNPDAKAIVMVRDPVKMAYALHSQLLYSHNEDVPNFQSAWRLQSRRATGDAIPKTCREPLLLQYGFICALGSQLQKVSQRFPADRLLVILTDDFARSTLTVYQEVLHFLNLPDDGRTSFPRINVSHTSRSRLHSNIMRILLARPLWLYDLSLKSRRALGIRTFGIHRFVNRRSQVERKRPPLPPAFESELREYFAPEVSLLESLLSLSLTERWTAPSQTFSVPSPS